MEPQDSDEGVLIDARDLRYSYGIGEIRNEVLHGVGAQVRAGEIVMVTGPSGSGKTTFLTLIGGLRQIQEGYLRVLGTDLSTASEEDRCRVRQQFGFIFQSHNLVESLTSLQNVQLSLSHLPITKAERLQRAEAILTAVGLEQHLAKRSAHLSGGQRQRVAIARALARRPKVVLADEPTASLDANSGREVMEILRALAREQGCGVIIVTHDHRILHMADRILALLDGNLEESHVGLVRITTALLGAARLLPSFMVAPEAGPSTNFEATLKEPEVDLDAWQQRQQSPFEQTYSTLLRERLQTLRSLKAALEYFAERRLACGSLPVADSGYQAVEALLVSAIEQLEEPDEYLLELLLQATSRGGRFAADYLKDGSRIPSEKNLLEGLMNFMISISQVMTIMNQLLEGIQHESSIQRRPSRSTQS